MAEQLPEVVTTDCPECNESIQRAWRGKENDVFHCEKCKLLVTKKKGK